MKYASIDIETTGLDPKTCQVLSIGIIIDDLSKKLPYEQCPKLEIVPDLTRIEGDIFAINMNKHLIDEILNKTKVDDRDYVNPNKLYTSAIEFLVRHLGDRKAVVAGKCFATFDDLFFKEINKTCSQYREERSDLIIWEKYRSRRILDPAPLYARLDDTELPNLSKCLERLGEEPTNLHNALGDAWDVCRLIRAKI